MSDYNPDTDPRSSNSLIRAYLASKGLPLNGENVRRALSGNAANPGMIPGLVNSTPSTEADDQAAMAAARHGIGGNSRGAGLPTPPIPPPGGGGGGTETTSAPPPSGGGGLTDDEISNAMLATAIASGGGAGALILKRALANRKPVTAAAPGATPEVPVLPEVNIGGFDAQGKSVYSGGPRGQPGEVPVASPAGPRSDIPFDAQGKPIYNSGPRAQPAPPAVPAPPTQPITTVEQFTAANPNAAVQPQITDAVPAIDQVSPRAKARGRARAPVRAVVR